MTEAEKRNGIEDGVSQSHKTKDYQEAKNHVKQQSYSLVSKPRFPWGEALISLNSLLVERKPFYQPLAKLWAYHIVVSNITRGQWYTPTLRRIYFLGWHSKGIGYFGALFVASVAAFDLVRLLYRPVLLNQSRLAEVRQAEADEARALQRYKSLSRQPSVTSCNDRVRSEINIVGLRRAWLVLRVYLAWVYSQQRTKHSPASKFNKIQEGRLTAAVFVSSPYLAFMTFLSLFVFFGSTLDHWPLM